MDLVTPSFVFFLWVLALLTMLCLGIIRYFWVEKRQLIERITSIIHSVFLTWSCFYLITLLFECSSLFLSGVDYSLGFVLSLVFLPEGICMGIIPQLLWIKEIRRNPWFFLFMAPFLLVVFFFIYMRCPAP